MFNLRSPPVVVSLLWSVPERPLLTSKGHYLFSSPFLHVRLLYLVRFLTPELSYTVIPLSVYRTTLMSLSLPVKPLMYVLEVRCEKSNLLVLILCRNDRVVHATVSLPFVHQTSMPHKSVVLVIVSGVNPRPPQSEKRSNTGLKQHSFHRFNE